MNDPRPEPPNASFSPTGGHEMTVDAAYAAPAVHRSALRFALRSIVPGDWETTYVRAVEHAEHQGRITSEEAQALRAVDAVLRPESLDERAALSILERLIDAPRVSPNALAAALIGRDNLLTGHPLGDRDGQPVHYKWWHADLAVVLFTGNVLAGGLVSAIAAL